MGKTPTKTARSTSGDTPKPEKRTGLFSHSETPDAKLVTVHRAACLLSLGDSAVWRLIRDNELETLNIGRRRMVVAASLDAYIAMRIEARRFKDAERKPGGKPVASSHSHAAPA
jgi:excisionase family DNA binding protein